MVHKTNKKLNRKLNKVLYNSKIEKKPVGSAGRLRQHDQSAPKCIPKKINPRLKFPNLNPGQKWNLPKLSQQQFELNRWGKKNPLPLLLAI